MCYEEGYYWEGSVIDNGETCRISSQYFFPVHFKNKTKHAVGSGMLGPFQEVRDFCLADDDKCLPKIYFNRNSVSQRAPLNRAACLPVKCLNVASLLVPVSAKASSAVRW